MKIAAIPYIGIAILAAVSVSAEEPTMNVEVSSEPMSAEPVAFLNVGRARNMPLTSEQAEELEIHQWPSLESQEIPRKPKDIAATVVTMEELEEIVRIKLRR